MTETASWIRAGRLIDGLGGPPIDDAAICVERGAITWVGESSGAPPGSLAEARVYPSATALPGLVDAHVHLSLFADGRSYEEMAGDSDGVMALAASRNAQAHLRAGITTGRDNGARNMLGFEIRLAIERGYIEGPRLLVAGRPITGTGGHFSWCNGVADGEEEIRRAVRRLVAEGADHIKVMASGGGTLGTDPARASYTVPELRAATATAHELGRLVTAHCRAKDAMDRAVEAKLDCIEHGEFLDHDGVPRFDPDTAKRMRDSGTFLSPTLAATDWDTILRLRAKRDTSGLDAREGTMLEAAEELMKRRLEVVNKMLDIGYGDHMVAGTDAGCFDYSFGHMDYNLFLFVEAGMSPMEAVMAGTRVSAAACGVGDLVGTLEPGKSADILLVVGNPLDDIDAIGRVAAVFKAGVLVPMQMTPADESTRTTVR